jgi:diketogulonate reductase-like aldo/keto reductase
MGLMEEQSYVSLNNGIQMPLLGLGVYDMHAEEAVEAVRFALQTGYRLIDTAAMYGNEKQIGEGIRRSGITREEIFVTTKVNNTDQGYDETLRAFDESIRLLGLDMIDLYLIHWPIKNKRASTWKAIEQLYQSGRVRAIGTGNYLLPFLHEMESYASIKPAVNQIEFSPYLFLKDELDYCRQHQICLQAYTPLLRGKKFSDPRLQQLALKYGKTPAQIILRWAIEQGISTIPKSSNPKRIRENFGIFDFALLEEDVLMMNSFDEGMRIVDDPMEMF